MYQSRVKNLPLRERPVSRLDQVGSKSCNLVELLAVVVGGNRQLEVAERLIAKYNTLSAMTAASAAELKQINGIGPKIAARVKASLELGLRLVTETPAERPAVRSSADAANLVMAEMSLLKQEHLRVILFNTRLKVEKIVEVYVGTLDKNTIRTCELFRAAMQENAASIILVHNHPSGNPTPSPEDIDVTRLAVEAGELLGIEVLDHIIIGKQRYVSLKERGLGFS